MRVVLCVVSLIGCHRLDGGWSGTCVGDNGDVGLELTIESDDGAEVEGSALATFEVAGVSTDAELDLEGTRDGADFAIDLDGTGWAMSLDGHQSGSTMEGDCLLEITVLGWTTAESGTFVLESTD